jgi:hypothetical protein
MASMNLDAYPFAIASSRILPEGMGVLSEKGNGFL